MTFNIAIVEDDDIDAGLLTKYLDRYAATEKIEFNIKRFNCAEEFLKDYRPVYSIVFLDIQMKEMNGMEAAYELRKKDKAVSLIFITSMVQYAQHGYEVDAVSFLVKPVNYYDLFLKLKKALNIVLTTEEHTVEITLPNGLCTVSTDKLMYVEVANHKVKYHLVGETLEMTGVLSAVEKQLKKHSFLRCNSCYLVNPKHIISVKGLDLQVGTDIIRISRPKRKAFMQGLADWLAGGK